MARFALTIYPYSLGRLRTILSAQEIVYLKEATIYANTAIDAFYDTACIGMSEIELAADIEYAMRVAGSDYPAVHRERVAC